MSHKNFIKFFSIFLLGFFLSLSRSIAGEDDDDKPFTRWKATVYPTDKAADLFWLSEEEATKAIEEAKTYSLPRISDETVGRLSKLSQEGLKKYGSFIDSEGKIYDDFKEVIQIDDFVVDKSGRGLGYGDCGSVYLSQHVPTKNFCAVKYLTCKNEESFKRLKPEIDNLEKTNRLIKSIRPKEEDRLLIFQHLVDGRSFPLWEEFFDDKSEDVVALIAWNFLREIIYLKQQKAMTADMNGNIMVDSYGRVFRIDMMDPYYTGKDIPNFNWDEEMYLYPRYGITVDRVIYNGLYTAWASKEFLNNSYAQFQSFLKKNNPKDNKDVKITWRKLFETFKIVIVENKTFEKMNTNVEN